MEGFLLVLVPLAMAAAELTYEYLTWRCGFCLQPHPRCRCVKAPVFLRRIVPCEITGYREETDQEFRTRIKTTLKGETP